MMTSQILKFAVSSKTKNLNNLESKKIFFALYIKGYNIDYLHENKCVKLVKYVIWKNIFLMKVTFKHLYLQSLFCLLINGLPQFLQITIML